MDVWKLAAPTLSFLSPDIYIEQFTETVAAFHRRDNPIFVPEANPEIGNLFVAWGQFNAIGFSPFGIEDIPEGHELFNVYRVLETLQL